MVHDDGACAEPSGLKEVLGQSVTGENVGVEPCDPALSHLADRRVPHDFPYPDLKI